MSFKVKAIRPGSWGDPQRTETFASEVEKIPSSPNSISLMTGNGIVLISVGDQFPSRVGGRLILRVRWSGTGYGVFYYEDGKIYGHDALYFWKESWMEAFQTGAHWARGGSAIAMFQVELCMGIMAGAGGKVAHWALTATDVLHLVSEVDIVALVKGLPKLLAARKILKSVAPRVYDKLFSAFVDKLLENVGESLVSAATAHFAGRALGRMGRHVPGQLLKTVKDIAGWATMFIILRLVALPALAAADVKTLAVDMKKELAKLKINVTEAEAELMLREMWSNKQKVVEAMRLMEGGAPESAPHSAPASERYQRGNRI